MILRKRFKAEVVDSWESTKCREPLCKLIAEKAETVAGAWKIIGTQFLFVEGMK